MRVAVAVDHAGYPLKETVVSLLERDGHEVLDCGTDSSESVDYPVHAARAARLLSDGEVDRAIVAGGRGTGVSIVANKFPGVRAVNARDPEDAEMSRRHNDANVLALSGRRLSMVEAPAIVETFLGTAFEGGRHGRRGAQIGRIESEGAPYKVVIQRRRSTTRPSRLRSGWLLPGWLATPSCPPSGGSKAGDNSKFGSAASALEPMALARTVTPQFVRSPYVSSDSTLRHAGAQQCWQRLGAKRRDRRVG